MTGSLHRILRREQNINVADTPLALLRNKGSNSKNSVT